MRFNNTRGRLGTRRRRRGFVVRRRRLVPYGRELHVTGVK